MVNVGGDEIVDSEMHEAPEKTRPGVPSSLPASDHATMADLGKAAKGILAYIDKENKSIDGTVYKFIESVEKAAGNTQGGGGDRGIMDALTNISERLQSLENSTKQQTTPTRNSSDSAERWRSFRARDFGAGAHGAPAPTSQSSAQSSAPGVAPADLGRDREIVVKIRDETAKQQLRQESMSSIVKKVEKAREAAAKRVQSAPLAGTGVIAAWRFPSGDVSLRARSAAEAEVLRHHGTAWIGVFGLGAQIRMPTWGVVAHGIPTKTINLTSTDNVNGVINKLQRENCHTWGSEALIHHIGWLIKPRKMKREGSLVIEFASPVTANTAIDQGTIWDREIHGTSVFCRDGRSKSCLKCQKFGHVQAQCPNRHNCGVCAAEHPTWECASKRGEPVTTKCANCGEGHKASSATCTAKKAAVQQAHEAVMRFGNYHRVPQHFRQSPTAAPSTTIASGGTNTSVNRGAANGGLTASRFNFDSLEGLTGETLGSSATRPKKTAARKPLQPTQAKQPKQQAAVTEKRRGPGRPPGSTNKPKAASEDNNLPEMSQTTDMALSDSQSNRPRRRSERHGKHVQTLTNPDRPLRASVTKAGSKRARVETTQDEDDVRYDREMDLVQDLIVAQNDTIDTPTTALDHDT